MKYPAILLAIFALYSSAAASTTHNITPRPQTIKESKGSFAMPTGRNLTYALRCANDSLATIQLALQSIGAEQTSWDRADIRIKAAGATDESYTLDITPRRISVDAPGVAGAFYAVQTLRQLIDQTKDNSLICMTVNDSPRFPYRGLHFDLSRHFRSIEFLKKQIDAMAQMKLNRMHLHLTDGAGWRMETDSFPRLTSYAAWRPQRNWMDWCKEGNKYCDGPSLNAYGGFYTKEQLRDLITYAAARHITIIPEIEMPGHSEEVLAAYPELGCSTAEKPSDFCPGKESTFKFLETVLAEVIEVFPSLYIHIGGDEAGKAAWHSCPDCQARMKAEGLDNVEELQSYLIKRIEKFVNSKGRRIIGWDEILEGGLAPEATVMSWRGTEGGLQAIHEGHDVIMTPGEFCYIDYSQDAPFREPVSIGGYTPLSKVYSYEPADPSLSPDETKHILGVQANLWSEYVTEDSHAEHMYYPRAYAIAEIGWSSPEKDYADFHRRALAMNDRLSAQDYAVFDLANEYGERRESLDTVSHKARNAKVIYTTPYHDKYPAAGDATLTDGLQGGWTYGDHRWQGWIDDMDVTVDLGEEHPINYISATFMHSEGAWVHLPESVTYSVSNDGKTFYEIGTLWTDVDPTYPKIMMKSYGLPVNTTARYIRLQAKKNPRPGAWLFTDEIIIN